MLGIVGAFVYLFLASLALGMAFGLGIAFLLKLLRSRDSPQVRPALRVQIPQGSARRTKCLPPNCFQITCSRMHFQNRRPDVFPARCTRSLSRSSFLSQCAVMLAILRHPE